MLPPLNQKTIQGWGTQIILGSRIENALKSFFSV